MCTEVRRAQQFLGAHYLHTAHPTMTRSPFQGASVMQGDQEQPDRRRLQGSYCEFTPYLWIILTLLWTQNKKDTDSSFNS